MNFLDDLPPSNARGSDTGLVTVYRPIAEKLRNNPGKWIVWPRPTKNPYHWASRINKGQMKCFPQGEFEAAVRQKVAYIRARPTS